MNKIYDAFGTELNIGDTIAVTHSQSGGRGYMLRKGKITAFTKTDMVKYEISGSLGGSGGPCMPSKVVKIGC